MGENLKDGDFALIIHLKGTFILSLKGSIPLNFSDNLVFFHLV